MICNTYYPLYVVLGYTSKIHPHLYVPLLGHVQCTVDNKSLPTGYPLPYSLSLFVCLLAHLHNLKNDLADRVIFSRVKWGLSVAWSFSKIIQIQIESPEFFIFTQQPLRAVGVLVSPMVSRWVGGWVGCGKKFVRAVSQKP